MGSASGAIARGTWFGMRAPKERRGIGTGVAGEHGVAAPPTLSTRALVEPGPDVSRCAGPLSQPVPVGTTRRGSSVQTDRYPTHSRMSGTGTEIAIPEGVLNGGLLTNVLGCRAALGVAWLVLCGGCGPGDDGEAWKWAGQAPRGADAPPPHPPAQCVVEGQRYVDGQQVPDPYSCNTCTCEDGEVAGCTEIGCSEECPAGTAPGTSCAQCGPLDACEAVETTCLGSCASDDECTDPTHPVCAAGQCRSVCG